MVARKAPEALDTYAERPGMMIRHASYLLRNGYSADDIFARLKPRAGELKTQTLVSLVSFFSAKAQKNEPPDPARRIYVRPSSLYGQKKPEADKARDYAEATALCDMFMRLLTFRLAANNTILRGKKIFVQMPDFDLSRSELRVTDKSSEGGYIRSGLAYRIPENVKCIRFFIYWNDQNRVDVDLHGSAIAADGTPINIGWNADYKSGAIVFSGDITHSDAAEYIDIDFEKAQETVCCVTANINLFAGYPTFGEIHECFVGAMAVAKTGTDIRLYNPHNCFFTHYLTGSCKMLHYGYIDVKRRLLVFDGIPADNGRAVLPDYYAAVEHSCAFSVSDYLRRLFAAQDAVTVGCPEAADLVLVMGKPSGAKEISLIDSNFFMES
jgi:hypothetical protein